MYKVSKSFPDLFHSYNTYLNLKLDLVDKESGQLS